MHHLKNQTYFKLFFIVTIFWNTLNLQVFGIQSNPLAWIAIVWGLGLFLIQIAKQEVAWKQYSLWLLLLYLGVTGFATFNNPFHTTSSIQLWLLQALVLLVVFPSIKKMSIPKLKQEMFLINALVCGLTFFASLASIFLFLANVSYSAHGVTLGLVGNRLFGVYFNSNPASFLAIIVVLFSLIALRNHTKVRWFYLLNIAVQLIYILLSNCRSALLIVLGILLVFTYYFMFKQKKYPWWRQALIMFVISLVFLFGSSLIKELLFLIPKLQGAVFEDGGRFQFDKIVQILSLMRSGLWSNKIEILTLADEISSGRVELYFNSLQAWRASP
ncbi:MAG: O-antigen ligase family protein, partial [Erysipelotrichaceae bacterium]